MSGWLGVGRGGGYFGTRLRVEHPPTPHEKIPQSHGGLPNTHPGGPALKPCSTCREAKDRSEFYAHPHTSDRLQSRCKGCIKAASKVSSHRPDAHRRYHLKYKYGITPDEYDAMFESQGGRCSICQRPGEPEGRAGLVVDHCHATGRVRALLCFTCNAGLGSFKDRPDYLTAAIEYLSRHRTNSVADVEIPAERARVSVLAG